MDILVACVKYGINGAIHAMAWLYGKQINNDRCIFLIHETNVFNSLKGLTAVSNIRWISFRHSKFLLTRQRLFSLLCSYGFSKYVVTREGTWHNARRCTLNDLLRIAAHAVCVRNERSAAAIGLKSSLMKWLSQLVQISSKYGIAPERDKSFVIFKKWNFVKEVLAALAWKSLQARTAGAQRLEFTKPIRNCQKQRE